MRKDCIKAISAALGRPLRSAETQLIESKIIQAKKQLAIKDRDAYLAMDEATRLEEAGKLAANQIKHDIIKKQQRIAKTVIAHDKIKNYLDGQEGLKIDNIDRILAPKGDLKDNTQSVETLSEALNAEYFGKISDELELFGPKRLGIDDNDSAMIPVFMELRGKDSGIPEAKVFAKKIKNIFDSQLKRWNKAGGDVGKLEDYGSPQSSSQSLVWKAGQKEWVDFTIEKLNRKKYVNEDGSLMNDEQLREFLNHAWESIAYDGALKKGVRGEYAKSLRANAHKAHRQIHFKDADSFLEYHDRFAEFSLLQTLISHISKMNSDIALIEKLGPNPENQFELWKIKAEQEAVKELDMSNVKSKLHKIEALFDVVSGKPQKIYSEKWARRMDAFRQYQNILLGSSVFTALSDEATAAVTVKTHNWDVNKYITEEIKNLSSSDYSRHMKRMGLGLDTLLYQINRYSTEQLTQGLSAKIGGAVVRASGMPFMTDARKRAFGAVMMDGLNHISKKYANFESIADADKLILKSKGITDEIFQVWKKAEPEIFSGNELLTPESIKKINGISDDLKQQAIDALNGIIFEESSFAIVTPTARNRALTHGFTRGTIAGELGLSSLQFKTFPIAMIEKHFSRAFGLGGKHGIYYGAAMVAGTTMMGAIAVQLNEIANGRDPLEMDNSKFMLKALAKGGGLGFYMDLFTSTKSAYGSDFLSGLVGGPTGQRLNDVLNLTAGNLVRISEGDPAAGDSSIPKLIKSLTPGSSLWYTKAAFDHIVFQQWQEMVSPGYLRRMERRAKREFKQSFYYKPGKLLPDRLPKLNRAIGQ